MHRGGGCPSPSGLRGAPWFLGPVDTHAGRSGRPTGRRRTLGFKAKTFGLGVKDTSTLSLPRWIHPLFILSSNASYSEAYSSCPQFQSPSLGEKRPALSRRLFPRAAGKARVRRGLSRPHQGRVSARRRGRVAKTTGGVVTFETDEVGVTLSLRETPPDDGRAVAKR